MYLLAVQTHLLVAPLGELVSQLKDIVKKFPPVSDTSLPKLLDVSECMSLNARWRVALATGETKRVWQRQHDQIPSVCGFPTRTEIVDKVKMHSPMAASLPLRCQELLGLHWEVAEQHGIQPRDHHFVWDLTNSTKFSCTKNPHLAGVVPCALRGHCLWDTKMGRPLSGTELMRVHGFCLEPAVAQLQNSIVRSLAGDTISVPPIGCILALALANTAPSHLAPSRCLPEHHVAANWIGPSSWRGFDRSKDNVMHLAGFPNKKKNNSQTRRRQLSDKKSGPSKRL